MEQKRTKKEEKGHGLANQVPVVGIGASAGGLEALQQFFYHCLLYTSPSPRD